MKRLLTVLLILLFAASAVTAVSFKVEGSGKAMDDAKEDARKNLAEPVFSGVYVGLTETTTKDGNDGYSSSFSQSSSYSVVGEFPGLNYSTVSQKRNKCVVSVELVGDEATIQFYSNKVKESQDKEVCLLHRPRCGGWYLMKSVKIIGIVLVIVLPFSLCYTNNYKSHMVTLVDNGPSWDDETMHIISMEMPPDYSYITYTTGGSNPSNSAERYSAASIKGSDGNFYGGVLARKGLTLKAAAFKPKNGGGELRSIIAEMEVGNE